MNELYNAEYYHKGCGPIPYEEAAYWAKFFGAIADRIVKDFHPETVLDAGCAMGYLVAALRDRGVSAYGVDISDYAISMVREDIRPYCMVGSITEPLSEKLPKHFDMVTNIEVLEHLYEADGKKAISNLCQITDCILFSSTADDLTEPTHVNVQQPEYWAKLFSRYGFYRHVGYDATYLSKAAMLFRKTSDMSRVVEDYERACRLLKSGMHQENAKVYFDLGNGFEEKSSISFPIGADGQIHQRIMLPNGCKTVRFDPVEGKGCLIWRLEARTDSALLNIESSNGIHLDKLYAFRTIDPEFYFEALPEHSHWLDLDAVAVFIDSVAWTGFITQIENIESDYLKCRFEKEELEKQLNDVRTRQIQQEESNREMKTALEQSNQERQRLEGILAERENRQQEMMCALRDYENRAAVERERAEQYAASYFCMANSRCWRMTAPVRRLLDRVKQIAHTAKDARPLPEAPAEVNITEPSRQVAYEQAFPTRPRAHEIIKITGNPIDPLETVTVDTAVKRLNLVTDTINDDSLLGGVATSLIVATEFVNRYGYELRIITRNTEVNPLNYERIMKLSGIAPAKKISYYSDYNRHEADIVYKLEISEEDVFFATSWWSARAIEGTTLRKRFFYIIQEVETFFYNYGSERVLCDQMMKKSNIDYIVNSGYLYHYFEENEPNITANGCYFEPAFPKTLYSKKSFEKKGRYKEKKRRYKLFFYARPNNPRNLYTLGLSLLDRAIEMGVLNSNEWDIYFAGQSAEGVIFCDGSKPINLGRLSWKEYAEFLADVDLGLCLMYTPHPSYPPFDVACSGGVVLTNRMLNKTEFEACKNVVMTDLDEEAFLIAFKEAVKLAKDMETRRHNYENSRICRDWQASLQKTIAFMKERIDHV